MSFPAPVAALAVSSRLVTAAQPAAALPNGSASADEITSLVARGLSAATVLTEITTSSVAGVKAFQKSVAEAVRTAPPGVAPPSMLGRITLQLDEQLGSLETEAAAVMRAPRHKRKVYGGAHAVERGPLRPPPPATPPKVYHVHVPSARRLAAIATFPMSSPRTMLRAESEKAFTGGMARGAPSRGAGSGASGGGGTSPPRRALIGTAPLDLTSDVGPRLRAISASIPASASAEQLRPPASLDGLTPGQRYLGALAQDRLAPVRSTHERFGRAMYVPVMPPPPEARVRRESSRALERQRQMERLRRRMFSQAQSWLMADEDEGGYVELNEEARQAAATALATALSPHSSQRSPRQAGLRLSGKRRSSGAVAGVGGTAALSSQQSDEHGVVAAPPGTPRRHLDAQHGVQRGSCTGEQTASELRASLHSSHSEPLLHAPTIRATAHGGRFGHSHPRAAAATAATALTTARAHERSMSGAHPSAHHLGDEGNPLAGAAPRAAMARPALLAAEPWGDNGRPSLPATPLEYRLRPA